MTRITRKHLLAAAALAAYVAAIVAANWLTVTYGAVWVLPGLMATAGTYAAGLALGTRDVLQDAGGRRLVFVAIAAGAALSWVLSSPQLAVASGAAFAVAELADMLVYTPLRAKGWARAVIASNVVGAIVDTFVFLSLAGFPVNGQSVSGQLVGKILWATLVPVAAVALIRGGKRRALLREPIHAAGA